jgi:hypothetical protein
MTTYSPPELWAAYSSPVSAENLTKAEEKLAAVENMKGNFVSSTELLNVCSKAARSLTMLIHLKQQQGISFQILMEVTINIKVSSADTLYR